MTDEEIASITAIASEANEVIEELTTRIRGWLNEGWSEPEITLAVFDALELSDPRKVLTGCAFAIVRLARVPAVSA